MTWTEDYRTSTPAGIRHVPATLDFPIAPVARCTDCGPQTATRGRGSS
jgi:hypothetical protein